MSYNLKCCSFYQNNFDASALVKRYNLTLSGSYKYYMNDLSFKNYLYAGLGYGTGQSCSKKKRYDNPMLS